MASCVCKSWSNYLSADHLWKPICNAHFPSLSVHQLADFPVPYHRLYAIGLAAAKRRVQAPGEPRLSLSRIIFALNIRCKNTTIVSLAKPAKYLLVDPKGVFRFDIAANYELPMMTGAMEEVRISWNVILRGWGAVFTMMDCEGKVNFSPGAHGWFSEELPPAGCCSSTAAPVIVSDVKIGLCTRRGQWGREG
ncbi:hypothetical protein CJ030_MR0G003677 [Morella rubra]|uniref:F-box protein n=1 Tax=Morella rubra TaxID=262757 RepID=A0A6A1UMF7_9ROSI|nr:hypothetical protein CJ030_MR0G003677 [Morella rubra]